MPHGDTVVRSTFLSIASLSLLLVLLLGPRSAQADKVAFEHTRDEVESALDLRASLRTPARIRPREGVRLSAVLVNRSKHSVKAVRPGDGCGLGIVEPHVRYSARFRATASEAWRDAAVRTLPGMCGMGDYRWHRNVVELAAGASLDFSARIAAASTFVDFSQPGHYEVTLHYAFRRRGTTTKLPQADAVGDLGPMARMPAFEISAEPVHVTVVRPLELVADVRGAPQKGVATRLSDLVRLRLENWTDGPLALSSKRLRLLVRLRPTKTSGRIRRKPISVSAGFVTHTLASGSGVTLIGPGGIYDEAWVAETDGAVELRVVVAGIRPGAPRLRSAWITLKQP